MKIFSNRTGMMACRGWGLAAMFMIMLLAACGEPPVKDAGAETSPAKESPGQTAGGAESLGQGMQVSKDGSVVFKPEPVNRAMLPRNVSKDVEVVTNITPGARGDRLTISTPSEPKTFNPLFVNDTTSAFASGLMFAGLIGYDQREQKVVPGLAKGWEYNPNTREWTFHLREGMLWSDGHPLTASDFLFFTELIYDKNLNSPISLLFQLDGKPDSPRYEFRTPNPNTLIVKIPGVDSFSFNNLGLVRPLPRHALEKPWKEGKFNETWGQEVDPKTLVVSGPYKLKELRKGEAIVFERNSFYYRFDTRGLQLPYFDFVMMMVVSDAEAAEIRYLEAGDLDIIETIKPDNLARFIDTAAKNNFKVYDLGPSLNTNFFYFNLNQGGTYSDADGKRQVWQPASPGDQPPAGVGNITPFVDPVKFAWFSNPEFRLACSEAANRKLMIDTLLFGQGTPLYGLISTSNKAWANPDIPKFPYNPDSAKQRLDKLGLIDQNNDGIREDARGNPVRFTIVTNRENNIREKVAQRLKQDLAAVGIGVDVQIMEFKALTTKLTSSFDYDCCLFGLASGVPPHPAMMGAVWQSSGRMHLWYPAQPSPLTDWEAEIDKLYASMKQTFDPAEQRKIFFQMQDILTRQQPVIGTFTMNAFAAAKNTIGNLKPNPLRSPLLHNIDELYSKAPQAATPAASPKPAATPALPAPATPVAQTPAGTAKP